MKNQTAAQKRLLQNATMTVATRLLFNALAEKYEPQVLSDVITIFNGQSLKKSERQDDGLFDVYGSGGLVGSFSEFLSEKPFVVIGRKGSAGKPTYAPFGGWVIDTAYYAQPNNINSLDTKYLYYGLSSIDFSDDIITTAIPGINRTAIYKHTLPVPPLDTQIAVNEFLEAVINKNALPELPDFLNNIPAIIARVESLAARVHEAHRLREEADYEADVFISSSLNKLVKDLEQNHKILFLEELLIDANYGTSLKCSSERTSGTIPVLRIPNVASEKVTLADLKYGDLSETELKKTVLSEGDILVVRTNGSKDLVGRCAVVHQLPEPMAFASYMIRIRCIKEVVLPEYLQLVLRQQRTGGYLIDFARTTAGQYNVSLGRLKNTKIPVPPLAEQRRIVAYLDGLQAKVNALRELQAESGKELSALMPSILDKAFNGEL